MKTAEAGIREYLQCNGIPEEKTTNITVITCTGAGLCRSPADLKAYFSAPEGDQPCGATPKLEQSPREPACSETRRAVLLREALLAGLYRAGLGSICAQRRPASGSFV